MINQSLARFKDVHKGERALYCGIGQTLDLYEDIPGIKVGAGDIVYHKVIMDYFFMTDPSYKKFGWFKDTEHYRNYKPGIEKIYRRKCGDVTGMPAGEKAVYYAITDRVGNDLTSFYKDVTQGLGFGVTTAVDVMQILAYMGFTEIVLIGHDCEYKNGSAIRNDHRCQVDIILNKWELIQEWLMREYPEINIYSINPVGIRNFLTKQYKDFK